MITVWILKGFVALLVNLAALLPEYMPPPAADLSAFQVIAWLVPINEIVNLAAVMVAFVVATLSYVSINWVINKSRGSG